MPSSPSVAAIVASRGVSSTSAVALPGRFSGDLFAIAPIVGQARSQGLFAVGSEELPLAIHASSRPCQIEDALSDSASRYQNRVGPTPWREGAASSIEDARHVNLRTC